MHRTNFTNAIMHPTLHANNGTRANLHPTTRIWSEKGQCVQFLRTAEFSQRLCTQNTEANVPINRKRLGVTLRWKKVYISTPTRWTVESAVYVRKWDFEIIACKVYLVLKLFLLCSPVEDSKYIYMTLECNSSSLKSCIFNSAMMSIGREISGGTRGGHGGANAPPVRGFAPPLAPPSQNGIFFFFFFLLFFFFFYFFFLFYLCRKSHQSPI